MTVAVCLLFATCIVAGMGLTFFSGLAMRAEERVFAGWTLGIVAFSHPEIDVYAVYYQMFQRGWFAALTTEPVRWLAGGPPDVIFECVGAPGLLQACIERAPNRGVIMGIGVCDAPDEIMPLAAFLKELRIQWAVGYDKEDFQFTIDMMVAGRIDATAMITNVVSLNEVPDAFEALRTPSDQCKVLIDLTL